MGEAAPGGGQLKTQRNSCNGILRFVLDIAAPLPTGQGGHVAPLEKAQGGHIGPPGKIMDV